MCTDPFLTAAEDQEGLDAVLLQVRIPLSSEARLHLVVSVQILQRGLGDVDPPAGTNYITMLKSLGIGLINVVLDLINKCLIGKRDLNVS